MFPFVYNRRDPRTYQVLTLLCLLLYGKFFLAFSVSWEQIIATAAVAVMVQWFCTRWFGLPKFDPRSALISSLSLCLLLRTDWLVYALLGIVIAVVSKFLLRVNGKHMFNPTNFGLAVMMLCTDKVWMSPGQWGNAAYFGLLMACVGILVVVRSSRSDVTFAFIAAYSVLLLGRAAWLGDPMSIPLHQLGSGAFLLFSFFMISDPMTTPNSRWGRILYACVVAIVSMYFQFGLFSTNALIWALVCCCPIVPVLDRLMRGIRYEWPQSKSLTLMRSEK